MNLETYAKKISPVFWQDLLQEAGSLQRKKQGANKGIR